MLCPHWARVAAPCRKRVPHCWPTIGRIILPLKGSPNVLNIGKSQAAGSCHRPCQTDVRQAPIPHWFSLHTHSELSTPPFEIPPPLRQSMQSFYLVIRLSHYGNSWTDWLIVHSFTVSLKPSVECRLLCTVHTLYTLSLWLAVCLPVGESAYFILGGWWGDSDPHPSHPHCGFPTKNPNFRRFWP